MKKIKTFLPLLYLIILIITSLYFKLKYGYEQGDGFTISVVGTAVSCVFFFFNMRKLYTVTILSLILFGFLNFISFFYVKYSITIGVGDIGFSFNPLFILGFVLFVFGNYDYFKKVLKKIFPTEINEELQKKEFEARVKMYKSKMMNKSNEELSNILTNRSKYLEEVITAAEGLLKDTEK